MSDTLKEFRWFSIVQWQEEQDYLRQRHAQGWRFVRVSGLGWYYFEACQPEDTVYQLDYNQEGLAHKQQYVQMFRDCGWEYLQDFFGYSYFRKPVAEMQPGEEGIFCDDDSRLQMMQRVFKGRMLPLLCVLFAIILPQLLLQSGMNGPFNRVIFWVYVVLLAGYIAIFASFGMKYLKFKQTLEK